MTTLQAKPAQRQRLQSLKSAGQHLRNTGKGLMLDDPEVVALVGELAALEGLSKREAVVLALRRALDD